MSYKPYPKSADTPSRKNRKSARSKVFELNRKARKLERKVAREQRQAAE